MRLSVEILDLIFSFLGVNDLSTLSSCLGSDDPVLSPIVERYLYRVIYVYIGDGNTAHTTLFKPDRLFRFLSENPCVKNHVRVLQVINVITSDEAIRTIAAILALFPNLEYITTDAKGRRWNDVFRASLKGPLNLSTVKEVRLVGEQTVFPFWLLDKCENLKNLFLVGTFEPEEDDQVPCDSTPARLKSLLLRISLQSSSLNWLKLRISQLESLTISSHVDLTAFPVLLEACSATLKELDICLTGSECYSLYSFRTPPRLIKPLPVFPCLPANLQRLTIRMTINPVVDENSPNPNYQSWLPAATELIRLFIPHRPRHLVLNITFKQIADLSSIDVSPLAVLKAASVSIPRIDLYAEPFHGSPEITDAELMSALEKHTEVVRLINEGKIAVHVDKTAPFPGD